MPDFGPVQSQFFTDGYYQAQWESSCGPLLSSEPYKPCDVHLPGDGHLIPEPHKIELGKGLSIELAVDPERGLTVQTTKQKPDGEMVRILDADMLANVMREAGANGSVGIRLVDTSGATHTVAIRLKTGPDGEPLIRDLHILGPEGVSFEPAEGGLAVHELASSDTISPIVMAAQKDVASVSMRVREMSADK